MPAATVLSPEEIRRRKNLKKGIDFTVMVCGAEGSGKSSFINTLCNQNVIRKDTLSVDPKKRHDGVSVDIVSLRVNIVEENSTPISLDIVLVSGFGDNIDNSACTGVIVEYLEEKFDEFLDEECSIQRNPKFKDSRPHAALYFIRPTSRGLRQLDVFAMKELSTRVNLIPVIGKADGLTTEELKLNKALILQDIRANRIPIFDFTSSLNDMDPEDFETYDELMFLKDSIPFAVSGSYDTKRVGNEVMHVREYPWGTLKVEDLEHSEFTNLKNVLFGSHLQELKETTHSVLYENYRRKSLLVNEESDAIGSASREKLYPSKYTASYHHYNSDAASVSNASLLLKLRGPPEPNPFRSQILASLEQDKDLKLEYEKKMKLFEKFKNELKHLEEQLDSQHLM